MKKNETTQFEQQISAFICQHTLFPAATPVYVGFSGGADSTALCLVLQQLNISFTAVHLHHGLRGEDATQDAAWCAEFCKARKIPFMQQPLHVPACRRPGESIESAARRCRLDFWHDLPAAEAVVALGHHADDDLENLLLRLGRGSNSSGLTGLRPRSRIESRLFVRPLLCVRRVEIERYLGNCGISGWCDDRTNQDPSLRRNAVRHLLLPAIRQIFETDEGFRRSLEALRDDALCLEEAAAAAHDALGDLSRFKRVPEALQPRILRNWLSVQLGRDVVVRHDAISRLRQELAKVSRPEPREIPVGDDIVLVLDKHRLRLKMPAGTIPPQTWKWASMPFLQLAEAGVTLHAERLARPVDTAEMMNAGANCAYFDAADFPECLLVRSWRPGDRMVPFGRRTPRKLKDMFNAARVPVACRHRMPVVLDAGSDIILWVPGVRHSATATVGTNTRETVCLRMMVTEVQAADGE